MNGLAAVPVLAAAQTSCKEPRHSFVSAVAPLVFDTLRLGRFFLLVLVSPHSPHSVSSSFLVVSSLCSLHLKGNLTTLLTMALRPSLTTSGLPSASQPSDTGSPAAQRGDAKKNMLKAMRALPTQHFWNVYFDR